MIFVHFNAAGGLSPAVLGLLAWYRKNVSRLMVVSNSPLDNASREALGQIATDIMVRENQGYDFGAWKDALASIGGLGTYDELYLTNDSVLGPVFPAETLFDRVSALPNDVCGLVASWEYGWHIQSWFVCYKRAAFMSEAFKDFWRQIEVQDSKVDLIGSYEVGLTRVLSGAGLSLGALFTPRQSPGLLRRLAIGARNMTPAEPRRSLEFARRLRHLPELNPMHFEWRAVLSAGIPLIKRELVAKNPNFVDLKGLFARFSWLKTGWVDRAN